MCVHDSNMQSKVAIFAGVNGPTWIVPSYLVNFWSIFETTADHEQRLIHSWLSCRERAMNTLQKCTLSFCSSWRISPTVSHLNWLQKHRCCHSASNSYFILCFDNTTPVIIKKLQLLWIPSSCRIWLGSCQYCCLWCPAKKLIQKDKPPC